MVIPRFVRQALAEQPITVHGDGSQRRCFMHVADAVQALADLMADERHYGEVFNIGSTEEISVAELAERVRARAGSSSPIQLIPYEEAYGAGFEDMARRVPDVAKIGRAIGWSATRSLDQILDSVIEHQRRTGES
jgi:UDP-glucose 4-epimerase